MFVNAAIFGVLSILYCAFTFYWAVVFSSQEDVEFGEVRFGGAIVIGMALLLKGLEYSLPTVFLLWLVILAIAVFLTYTLEVGLIAKKAAIATVLFLIMFVPGYLGICCLLDL